MNKTVTDFGGIYTDIPPSLRPWPKQQSVSITATTSAADASKKKTENVTIIFSLALLYWRPVLVFFKL